MKKLSPGSRKWLKGFHISFGVCWAGAGITLTLMQICIAAESGGERYGVDVAMKFIDDFILIPAAMGTLVTAIIYSVFTNWGWFKHNWITVKWIICVGGAIFGTFWLGPWMNSLPPISSLKGLDALSDPAYVHARTMTTIFGGLQASTILVAVFLSVIRPWRKRRDP